MGDDCFDSAVSVDYCDIRNAEARRLNLHTLFDDYAHIPLFAPAAQPGGQRSLQVCMIEFA